MCFVVEKILYDETGCDQEIVSYNLCIYELSKSSKFDRALVMGEWDQGVARNLLFSWSLLISLIV